jgi:hypothetical protein
MLTGVALARRMAARLVPAPTPFTPTDGFTPLFDGFTTDNWRFVGKGGFRIVDGAFESMPGGDDLGLNWCETPMPADFILKLEWLRWQQGDNSGVFVRFPDPTTKGYNNQAWVAVQLGFEVQDRRVRRARRCGHPQDRRGLRRADSIAKRGAGTPGRPVERIRNPRPRPELHRAAERDAGHAIHEHGRRAWVAVNRSRAELHWTSELRRKAGRVSEYPVQGGVSRRPVSNDDSGARVAARMKGARWACQGREAPSEARAALDTRKRSRKMSRPSAGSVRVTSCWRFGPAFCRQTFGVAARGERPSQAIAGLVKS